VPKQEDQYADEAAGSTSVLVRDEHVVTGIYHHDYAGLGVIRNGLSPSQKQVTTLIVKHLVPNLIAAI
jgi:hypothetical protein